MRSREGEEQQKYWMVSHGGTISRGKVLYLAADYFTMNKDLSFVENTT